MFGCENHVKNEGIFQPCKITQFVFCKHKKTHVCLQCAEESNWAKLWYSCFLTSKQSSWHVNSVHLYINISIISTIFFCQQPCSLWLVVATINRNTTRQKQVWEHSRIPWAVSSCFPALSVLRGKGFPRERLDTWRFHTPWASNMGMTMMTDNRDISRQFCCRTWCRCFHWHRAFGSTLKTQKTRNVGFLNNVGVAFIIQYLVFTKVWPICSWKVRVLVGKYSWELVLYMGKIPSHKDWTILESFPPRCI